MENTQKQGPVPEAWKEGNLGYSTGLTLDTAKKMLEAAEREAREQELLMVIAIADCGGNLVALHRMDNSMLASIGIAMDKAYTAVYGKLPSMAWGDMMRSGDLPSLFIHQRWTAFPGGFPLIRDGKLFGGVGASGATKFGDLSVARAAMAAGGFSTDDIDAILSEITGS
jgi:uncharacterized protein GlcG (DUF336 family)